MNSNRSLLLWLVAITILSLPCQASAQQTTAFTYQGQLRDGGTNANGTYAMTFKLYDAFSGGGQIGSPVTTSPTLANGLFTVNLDFGAGAFNGSTRWLDISVQAGTNAPETLTPRVQVLPAPYAIFAALAATVTNGAIMNAQLANNAVNSPNIASGQVVKSLNGLKDNVTLAAGANVSVFTNGNALQFSAGVPNIQVFTTDGTFVVPTNVTKIMVEVWGGGGAGGPYSCVNVTNQNVITTYCNPGGGGGAGSYTWDVLSVIPSSSHTVMIANGGSGGGNSGGTSSFGGYMSAGGGFAGTFGGVNPGFGGSGGTSTGGLAQVRGASGESASNITGGHGGHVWRGSSGGFSGNNSASGGPGGGGGGGNVPGSTGGGGGGGLVIIYY